MRFFLHCFLAVICFYVVNATEIRGRGLATVINFNNGTDLAKRSGRGTW